MTVKTGEGLHTSYDELFARANCFVFLVKANKPDLGSIKEKGIEIEVNRVEVLNTGRELVEISHLSSGETRQGRRKLISH